MTTDSLASQRDPLNSCVEDFPALQSSGTKSIVYLDSAATTLKPLAVINAVRWFLEEGTSSVHRGVNARSIEATERFEATREKIARWFGAETDEIILTHGATEAINLIRRGWKPLRRVAMTVMEHHSNFVPWLDLPQHDVIPVDREGSMDLDALRISLQSGANLVAVTQMSNVLGSITDLEVITQMAHQHGAKVLVDAAQAASHHPLNVRELPIDFMACSGHKMLAPSGCGALYVRRSVQPDLEPLLLGGNMVDQVTITDWTAQEGPERFEAGTPAIESVIGWGAAIDYLQQLGTDVISRRLRWLTHELVSRLEAIPGITIHGADATNRGPLVAFSVEGLESTAVAKILSQRDSILVRSGFHCAQPLHQHLGIRPTVRASLQIYNTIDDLNRFAKTLTSIAKLSVI